MTTGKYNIKRMNTSDTNERNVRIHLLMTYLLFTVNLIWQTHDKSKKVIYLVIWPRDFFCLLFVKYIRFGMFWCIVSIVHILWYTCTLAASLQLLSVDRAVTSRSPTILSNCKHYRFQSPFYSILHRLLSLWKFTQMRSSLL